MNRLSGGVKPTNIVPFVLLCVVALAVASSIGIALLPNIAPRLELKSSQDTLKHAPTMAKIIHIMGDPIDDPRPNKH